jgi:DNA topoisomerase-1
MAGKRTRKNLGDATPDAPLAAKPAPADERESAGAPEPRPKKKRQARPRKAAGGASPKGIPVAEPAASPPRGDGAASARPTSKKAPPGKPVVIVESPAKARTINKILGGGFVVKACMGHVRDLPKGAFGIKVENNFQPTYQTIKGKTKIVSELKAVTQQAETVYLAPDPDREGEAIAWHLVEALKIPKDRARRVTFNEITQRGVLEAFKHPGDISMPRVNAQQARRFLDRIVGYKLSPLLWKKVGRGLSAGRVQSVAVRLVVERERQIQAFRPEEYWRILAKLDKIGVTFSATLTKLDGREIGLASEATGSRPSMQVSGADQSRSLVEELKAQVFEVVDVRQRERQEPPPSPFTTSLLQQQAWARLHFSAKRTMIVAQQLYEGVELGSEGAIGLITYMRTDSFRIASEALGEVRALIVRDFGANYVPERPVLRAAREGAQEAHEAIRPTYVGRKPEEIKPYLSEDQYRLYRLIWRRFVACQMKPARYLLTEAEIRAGRATFAAKGRELKFDGFTALLGPALGEEQQTLPTLAAGDRPILKDLTGKQHFTEPPPRYTEASLVKALERNGIGRPSTYAPILSTIQERGYVRDVERKLHPTELGTLINDKLVKHFNEIMELGFTAKMEKNLDDIEEGGRRWTDVLKDFNDPFMKGLDRAKEEMESEKGQEATGEACPKCGKPMMIRWNKYGRFLGCAGFPECKQTKSLASEATHGETCDQCQSPMLIKSGRLGRFLACSRYPDCRGTRSLPRGNKRLEIPKDWKEDCEKCGKSFRIRYGRRGGFIACSGYPTCKNTRRFPKAWYRDYQAAGASVARPSAASDDAAESSESEGSEGPE